MAGYLLCEPGRNLMVAILFVLRSLKLMMTCFPAVLYHHLLWCQCVYPCKLLSISCCLVWTAPCLVQMAETNVRILLFHFLVMSFCSIYWFTRLTNWCFGSRGCDGMASMSNIVMQLHRIDSWSYRGISAALSSGIAFFVVCFCLLLLERFMMPFVATFIPELLS